MKRFLAFGGEKKDYGDTGGWHDFVGSYDTAYDASIALLKVHTEWWQIVDTAIVFPNDPTVKSPALPPKIVAEHS